MSRESAPPERRFPAVHERPWAVFVYLACAALTGLAWAAPVASVMSVVTRDYPRGDAELFDPGGVMLLEALRRLGPSFAAIRMAWLLAAIVALPLGLAAFGFAVAQLGTPGKSRPSWALVRAAQALPTLVVIGIVALVADVVIAGLLTVAGGAITKGAWPEPPARDVARLVLVGVVVLAIVGLSAIHDLTSVAAVTGPARTYMSLRAGLHVVWRTPGRAAWAFAWRFVVGLVALGLAFAAGLAIGERGPGAILASAFVHQLGLAAAGWCRLSWLSACGRLVRPVVVALARRSGRGGPDSEEASSPAAASPPEPSFEQEAVMAAAAPSVAEPSVAKPSVAEPLVTEPSVADLSAAEPLVAEPAAMEPSVAEPAVAEPFAAERVVVESLVAEPSATGSSAVASPSAAPAEEASVPSPKAPNEEDVKDPLA